MIKHIATPLTKSIEFIRFNSGLLLIELIQNHTIIFIPSIKKHFYEPILIEEYYFILKRKSKIYYIL